MTAGGARQGGAVPARSLGRWLVMRYPAAWRERYGDEMLALLDDAHVRWMDVLDLTRGLVVERARALIEPGQRPFVTLALFAIALYLTGLSLTLAAYGLGQVVHLVAEPSSTRVAAGGQLLVICAWLATLLQIVAWQVRHPGRYPWIEHPLPRGRTAWLAVGLAGIAIISWAHPAEAIWWLFFFPVLVFYLLKPARWQRAHAAILQLSAAKREMKWAMLELERCERLEAEGLPGPAADARAAIARMQRTRQEALAALDDMGYRARFRA